MKTHLCGYLRTDLPSCIIHVTCIKAVYNIWDNPDKGLVLSNKNYFLTYDPNILVTFVVERF